MSGRNDGPSEDKLTEGIEQSVQEAIHDDGSLRDLIAEDGIEYLARRAARRTIANKASPEEAVEQARRTYGRIARDLYRASTQTRGVTTPPTPTPRGDVDRLVEKEDRICGIFPWC